MPGPDGIGSIAPLVSTGLIRPWDGRRTAAAFTGGYKRTHGAFKYGELAVKNHGSHYGFMENGVVFSKLQPGLATIFVLQDGSIEMKTWAEADNKLLPRIKHARQNGVPLVEFDEASQSSVPGRWVANWGAGNWSGSEDVKLRTLRAGAALQKNHGKRFLIYALFSDATPSAMARVFRGLPMPLRHAPGHERPRTYLSGGLSKVRIAILHRPPRERNEPGGKVQPLAELFRVSWDIRTTGISSI